MEGVREALTRRHGPPHKEWYKRWRRHLILVALQELSAVLQHGWSAMDISTVMRWFMLPIGCIMGGFAVSLVEIIVAKLESYLSQWVLCIIVIGVILGGPDLLPPLTLANGCESLMDRLKWTTVFALFHYIRDYLPEPMQSISSFNFIFIISGIWHFDRGDYNYNFFSWVCANRTQALSQDNVKITVQSLALYHFQAAAGVGMLWAAFGVYSFGAFFKALLLYLALQLFTNLCLGGREEEQNG